MVFFYLYNYLYLNILFLVTYSIRQLALKALNERLNKPDTTISWPTLEEDDETSNIPSPSTQPVQSSSALDSAADQSTDETV